MKGIGNEKITWIMIYYNTIIILYGILDVINSFINSAFMKLLFLLCKVIHN